MSLFYCFRDNTDIDACFCSTAWDMEVREWVLREGVRGGGVDVCFCCTAWDVEEKERETSTET